MSKKYGASSLRGCGRAELSVVRPHRHPLPAGKGPGAAAGGGGLLLFLADQAGEGSAGSAAGHEISAGDARVLPAGFRGRPGF